MHNKKIKIAVIDSGINKNSSMKHIDIIHAENHNFETDNDFLNHGTICASIIGEINQECTLFNVKVFDKRLYTSSRRIINAIKWCIDNRIDIINLSLSITDLNCYYELKTICDEAYSSNCLIIAAADNLGRPCSPAYFENVIGVGIADIPENKIMYTNSSQIHYYANGTYSGTTQYTSFATARVCGMVSNIINNQVEVPKSFDKLLSIIQDNSIVYDYNKIACKNIFFDFHRNTKNIFTKHDDICDKSEIQNVSFLGTYNESFLLNRYNKLLKIPVKNITYIERKSDNKHFFNHSVLPDFCLPSNYEPADSNVIIGDITTGVIREFIQKYPNNKLLSIYSTTTSEKNSIKAIFKSLSFDRSALKKIKSEHIFRNSIPTIAFLNLSMLINLLPIELAIHESLEYNEIKAAIISQSMLSPLWGMDFLSKEVLPLQESCAYIKSLIEYHSQSENTGLIMSINAPILSPSKTRDAGYAQSLLYYTSLMFGYQADSVYLIVDEFTDLQEILNTIQYLKSFMMINLDGIVILDFNKISNNSFYFSDVELKIVSKKNNQKDKFKKMKTFIKENSITENIIDYEHDDEKRYFSNRIINLIKEYNKN